MHMPTCPGCRETVPYDRLAVHERYCVAVGSAGRDSHTFERLEARLAALEARLGDSPRQAGTARAEGAEGEQRERRQK